MRTSAVEADRTIRKAESAYVPEQPGSRLVGATEVTHRRSNHMAVETLAAPANPEGDENRGGTLNINWQGAIETEIAALLTNAGMEVPEWFTQLLGMLNERGGTYPIEIALGFRLLGFGPALDDPEAPLDPERMAFYSTVAQAAEQQGAPWDHATDSFTSDSWKAASHAESDQQAAIRAEYAALVQHLVTWTRDPSQFQMQMPATDSGRPQMEGPESMHGEGFAG